MILVCGEALMDVFPVGEAHGGLRLEACVGGSPFNVAIGLARLGQPVAFLGGVSSGFLGERLVGRLREEGVHTAAVWRSQAPTTLSLVGVDAAGLPSYHFYGEGAADRLVPPEALAQIPESVGAVHLGSLACVVEPVAHTLREAVLRLRERCVVSYDPNVRLGVEPDAAVWRRQLAWMLPRTDLIKLSTEDLDVLAPGHDPEAFAREALAQGVAVVVLTRGGSGAIAWSARCRVSIEAPAVAVVDTVGAGDTLQAAWLAWLCEHQRMSRYSLGELDAQALEQGLRFAVAAAAVTCSRRGADLPRRGELPG
jgi:fructokinase